MAKQFGLLIPGELKKLPVKPSRPAIKPSIFDESSDSSASDHDGKAPQMRPTGKAGVVSGPSLMERRVARNLQSKALAEDPTIFQYDELYDDMDTKREKAKETKKLEPRKAKYIDRLMVHAERRKLENELRIERQVQKDREAEGEMYKDKDTFVTLAYRKKLESIRKLQEDEQHEEYLEGICDVTKQKNLDGFYRHMFEQKLGTREPAPDAKTMDVAYKPIKNDVPSSSKQRSYRRRRSSEDNEKPDTAGSLNPTDESKPISSSTKAHLSNNIDADSDFSIDSSSDEEHQEPKVKQAAATDGSKPALKSNKQSKATDAADEHKQSDQQAEPTRRKSAEESANDDTDVDVDNGSPKEKDVPTVVKPPIDRSYIWRKQTVGDVFDAALARYHERKVARRTVL